MTGNIKIVHDVLARKLTSLNSQLNKHPGEKLKQHFRTRVDLCDEMLRLITTLEDPE